MSSSKSVARAGLFDRLVDHEPMNPEEVRPKRAFNKKEFIDSVLRELNCLLNTRSPIPPDQLGLRERSVIDYGVPDFTALYAKDLLRALWP